MPSISWCRLVHRGPWDGQAEGRTWGTARPRWPGSVLAFWSGPSCRWMATVGGKRAALLRPGWEPLLCEGGREGAAGPLLVGFLDGQRRDAGKRGYGSLGGRGLPWQLLQKQSPRAGEDSREFSGEATESSFRDLIGGVEQSWWPQRMLRRAGSAQPPAGALGCPSGEGSNSWRLPGEKGGM